MKPLIRFGLLEVIGKTLVLCFLSTLITHLILTLNPVVREPVAPLLAAAGASADESEQRLRRYLQDDVHAFWLASNELLFDQQTRLTFQHLLTRDLAAAAQADPAIVLLDTGIRQEHVTFYFSWLSHLVRGDLGYIVEGQDVWSELKSTLPLTFAIAIAALLATVTLAFAASAIYALRSESKVARAQEFLLYAASTMPAFITGYLFLRLLGVNGTNSLGLVVPVVTLVISNGLLAELLVTLKSSLRRAATQNYVTFARSKGLTEWEILRRHVLRNTLMDLLPRVSQKMAFIVSGTIVVEKVFSLNGLADMLIDGLGRHDNGRVLVVILVATLLVRIGSLSADALLYSLNPKQAAPADA